MRQAAHVEIDCLYCGTLFMFSLASLQSGTKPWCASCGEKTQLKPRKDKGDEKGDVYGYRFSPPFAEKTEERPRAKNRPVEDDEEQLHSLYGIYSSGD